MKNNHLKIRISLLIIALGVILASLALKGETRPAALLSSWQINRQAMPTAAADISTLGTQIPTNVDLYVCQLDLAIAPGSGTVNVSIYDKQASPMYLFNTVPMIATASAGQSWTNIIRTNADQGCPQFKGGMVVQASGAGVTIYTSGKY